MINTPDTPEAPAPTISSPSSTRLPPTSQVRALAQLACLLCGRPVATAEADTWPPTGPVLLRTTNAAAPRVLPRSLGELRCGTCGGNAVVAEVTRLVLRFDPPVDWEAERPLRGRPPNWLLAMRLAANADQVA